MSDLLRDLDADEGGADDYYPYPRAYTAGFQCPRNGWPVVATYDEATRTLRCET